MNDRVDIETALPEARPDAVAFPTPIPVFEPPIVTPPGLATTQPRVTGFSPPAATVGSMVTVFGENFLDGTDNSPTVMFGNVPATNRGLPTSTTINVFVPGGALDAPIKVLTKIVPAIPSQDKFIVAPKFERNTMFGNGEFNPVTGRVGDKISLFGSGLVGCTVVFSGSRTEVQPSETAPFFTARIPADAMDGPITLIKPGAPPATSTDRLTIQRPPIISDVSPGRGAPGTEVMIRGSGFGANNGMLESVTFTGSNGRVPAKQDDPRNTNQVIFTVVPPGAVSGPIRVRRRDEDLPGESPDFRIVPAAPAGLVARVDAGAIALSWQDNSNNENGFSIERRDGSNGYAEIARVGANITTFRDTNVLPGVAYVYRIKAIGVDGNSLPSNEAGALISSSTTATFTGFSPASGAPGSSVRLFGSGLMAVISIRFASLSGPLAASISALSDQAIDVVVPAGALSGPITLLLRDGRTLTSPVTFVVTGSAAPAAPTELRVTVAGSQINVSWTDNSNNESGFRLERRTAAGGYQPLAMLGANITVYADTNVVPGVSYCYRVKAFNAAGESMYSNEACALPAASTLPIISSFSPTSGAPGTQVSIRGSNFLFGDLAILFNGFEAAVHTLSAAEAIATVPQGAGSGPIRVINAFGSAVSASNFVVSGGAGLLPVINDFTPRIGTPGSTVALAGVNFDGTAQVSFNGAPASRTVNNAFSITATVPANASSGPIVVTTASGSAASPGVYTVTSGSSATPPTAPTGLSAQSGPFEITLRWNDNSGNEDGFRVERQDSFGNFVQVAAVGANTRSYTDSPLSPSTTYTYRIKAFNAAGESAASNTASARPLRISF